MLTALWIALSVWLVIAAGLCVWFAIGTATTGQRVDLLAYAWRSLGWPWAVAQWAWHRALRFSTIRNGWVS